MPSGPLVKVTAKSAADIGKHVELSDAARPLLRSGISPAQFLDALLEQQLYEDASKFLAQALPKREAVWWACQCTRTANGSTLPPAAAAVKAAETWVANPTEENRRAAIDAATVAQFGTPAGCAALAAFLSGGSLAPAGLGEVPPAEHLTGRAVAGAVMLSAVIKEPEKAKDKFRAFLKQGVDIGNGKGLWK